MNLSAVVRDRRKWTARCDQRLTVGPRNDVDRLGFTAIRGVREGQHDRACAVSGHRPDDLFGERPTLPRRSDQHRGLVATHDAQQVTLARIRQSETRRCGRRPCKFALVSISDFNIGNHKATRVHDRDAIHQLRFRYTLSTQARTQLSGDADARCARTVDQNALLGSGHFGDAHGREHAGERNGTGALNVVVKRRQHILVALHDRGRIVFAKVLPLHQRTWECDLHRLNKLFNQCVVFGPTHARLRPTQIHVVVEHFLVVRADIDAHG